MLIGFRSGQVELEAVDDLLLPVLLLCCLMLPLCCCCCPALSTDSFSVSGGAHFRPYLTLQCHCYA